MDTNDPIINPRPIVGFRGLIFEHDFEEVFETALAVVMSAIVILTFWVPVAIAIGYLGYRLFA